jgi:stringent starvation protein B
MKARIPGKKQVLLAYLERGVAMVHLDARRPGVAVPSEYRDEAHLRLNLSYRYGIPDLAVDDARVQATLSFGGRPFHCILPWESIFGITSHAGEGQVWPEDLPVEISAPNQDALQPAEEPRAPVFKVVEREQPGQPRDGSAPPHDPPPKRHLRLVR